MTLLEADSLAEQPRADPLARTPKVVARKLPGHLAEAGGIDTVFGGDVISGNPEQHPPTSELIGLGVAVIVLLFAFGSVLAMGIPLVTALIGLGTGLMGITLASAFFDLS